MANGLSEKKPIRLLAISASPRKNGNTQFILEQAVKCIENQKFPVELTTFSFAGKKMESCLGCLACYKNGGNCIIKDSFEIIRRLWKESDCILYCTPVYVAGIPGQLKNFIDRLSNADYGMEIRGARHMKTIGVIAQGGDFFGGGAELCMVDIMRHAAMMNCIYIPPDASYIGSGGWVWDSHRKAMQEKAQLDTKDYQLTLENACNIITRSVEMAAVIREGAGKLKSVLEKDEKYRYYYERTTEE